MKGMSLTLTRLRVAVRVMGYYKFGTPYRGYAGNGPCKGRSNH